MAILGGAFVVVMAAATQPQHVVPVLFIVAVMMMALEYGCLSAGRTFIRLHDEAASNSGAEHVSRFVLGWIGGIVALTHCGVTLFAVLGAVVPFPDRDLAGATLRRLYARTCAGLTNVAVSERVIRGFVKLRKSLVDLATDAASKYRVHVAIIR